jgi:hypothetical protein
VTAKAVTTRTATTHEDLSTNAKTQQLEEKTVATTTKQIADRQEQKVIRQEVKTTVTSGEQVSRHHASSFSFPLGAKLHDEPKIILMTLSEHCSLHDVLLL